MRNKYFRSKDESSLEARFKEQQDQTTTLDGTVETQTEQLEQITKKRLYGFDEYGFFQKPSDFTPTLPCSFWRNSAGDLQHNMNFAQFKGGTRIYVTLSGNDSTGNGSESAPYKTLKKAFEVARLGVDASYEIITTRTMFNRDEANFAATYVGKNIAVVSTATEKTIISSNASYTWTLDGAGTYKAGRSGVTGVIDNTNRDANGLPIPLVNVASVVACQSTAGTWYTDGTTVWVHRTDEAIPTQASTIVSLAVPVLEPILSGSTMYFENFIFCGWDATSGNALKIRAGANSLAEKVCFYNCGFVASHPRAGNGLAAVNIKDVYVFDCIAAYGQQDGYNYHYNGITTFENRRTCLVVEYNCLAYHLGIEYPNAASNNASSAHEGINIIRFGTIGYQNTGATIIDVNGCYSILVDCDASDPVINGVSGAGTAYCFSSEGDGEGLGKTYMLNCKASNCVNALTISATHTAYTYGLDYVGTIVNNGTLIQQ